jgi:hypothetical protein
VWLGEEGGEAKAAQQVVSAATSGEAGATRDFPGLKL